MGTSLSEILEPADLIINFLFTPRLIYFCAFFAYDGLKNGVTLTHFGIRKGLIARIYGVFYLLFCVVQLLVLPNQLKQILAVDPSDMTEALLFSTPIPIMAFFFFGLAGVILLIREVAIALGKRKMRRTTNNLRRIRMGRQFMNWMIAMIFAMGVPPLLGLPYFFTVVIFAFFTYFAPLTSPIAIKELMSMPIDENKPPQKSAFLA